MKPFQVHDGNMVSVSMVPDFARNLAKHLLQSTTNPAFLAFAHQIENDANEVEPPTNHQQTNGKA